MLKPSLKLAPCFFFCFFLVFKSFETLPYMSITFQVFMLVKCNSPRLSLTHSVNHQTLFLSPPPRTDHQSRPSSHLRPFTLLFSHVPSLIQHTIKFSFTTPQNLSSNETLITLNQPTPSATPRLHNPPQSHSS